MPTYTPIQASETLDRTNWYYIPGNIQDPADTSYQPRNPFGTVDGVTENIITFWNTAEKMLSYKNAITGTATLTLKIIRGGGGSSQPTYNIKLANNSSSQVFHTATYDCSSSATWEIQTSTTGYTKTDSWTTQKTVTFSGITNTGWTEISQTVTGSNFYINIRQIPTANFGGFAIADVTLTISDVTYDKSPDVLRGFLIPYPINTQTAIWDSQSNFTQQNPRAGSPQPQQSTGLNILTTGSQEDETDISIRTDRAGSTNTETGKKASFIWGETANIDSSPYGWDYPTSIQNYYNISTGSNLQSLETPDVVRIPEDESLIIVYADTNTASRKVRIKKITANGNITTTTLFSTLNTLNTPFNPAICILSNGDILVVFWYAGNSTTNAQLISYLSRDSGDNWTQSSTNCLMSPFDISSTGHSIKKTRILANEQQVLIVSHIYSNYTTSNIRNRVFSAASSNQGASFKTIQVDRFSSGNQAFFGMFLNKNNQFTCCFLVGNDGDEAVSYTIPHAFFPLTNASINPNTIFQESGQYVFYMNPTTYEIEKGLNAEIIKDEDGIVYCLFRHVLLTGDEGSYFLKISTDENTWYYQSGAESPNDERYLFRSEEVDSTLNEMKMVSQKGRLAIISNFKSKNQPANVENSLVILYLGGYSDRTLVSDSDIETPIYKALGLYKTWLPFDLPNNTGLFGRTGGTGDSIIDNVLNINTSSSLVYYNVQTTVTPATGFLIRTSLQPISGGSDTALERAIYLKLIDTSNSYIVQIRISTNKVAVYDETAGSNMGEYSFGTEKHIDLLISMYSNQILVYIANQHRVLGGIPNKQYTLINESNTTVQNGGTPSISYSEILWGHISNMTAETNWYEFHSTRGNQYTNYVLDNSPLLSREYPSFGQYLYINGGLKITTKDSPTYKGDTWQIEQTADYPIEKIFFSESPNMEVYWRSQSVTSGNVPNNFIPILLDANITTGANSNFGMGNDLIAFHLEGINFRNFFIKYRDGESSPNIWSVKANVDVSTGLTGNFTREGATIIPSNTTANPSPFFAQYGEFIGAIAELDDGGGTVVRRRIQMNTSGVFSNVNSQRCIFKLENPDSSDPTTGTLRIIPTKVTIVISLNDTKGVAWAIDIPAQETIDNYFSISNLTFGEVAIFSPQYGRGRNITFDPNTEIFESPDGTIKPKRRGKGRRTARISWTDGVDTRDLYGNLQNLQYYKSSDSTNSQPVATWGDIPLKIQGIYKYCSGEKPIVYLPYIEYSTSSLGDIRVLNRDELHIFGLLDGGMSFDHVIGDEYADEVHRIATLVIKEII